MFEYQKLFKVYVAVLQGKRQLVAVCVYVCVVALLLLRKQCVADVS